MAPEVTANAFSVPHVLAKRVSVPCLLYCSVLNGFRQDPCAEVIGTSFGRMSHKKD
jgi:hypothetical protein